MRIPFIKGDSIEANVDYTDAMAVNVMGVNQEIMGAKGYYISFAGLVEHAQSQGADRGAVWVSRTGFSGHYRVSGDKFVKVSSDGTVIVLGTVAGDDLVRFAYSFNNIAIVASGRLYYYNPNDGFREVIDPEVGNPTDIIFIDSYFMLTDGLSVYHSTLADEEQFSALDFSDAQFTPDATYGLERTESNEAMVFGQFSVEYFRNTGAANFAFQRTIGKAQKIGILGAGCKVEYRGTYYCLGRRKETQNSCYVLGSGREQKIASRAVDKIIGKYKDAELSGVTIDAIEFDNVTLIIYHLPNETLCFNQSIAEQFGLENGWSVLASSEDGTGVYQAYNFIRDGGSGNWIGGSKLDGTICRLDDEVCTQFGERVGCIMYTPLVESKYISINKLEIQTIGGYQSETDTVFTSATHNGLTYSDEYMMSYSTPNDYDSRFILRRLGYFPRDFGFRFRTLTDSRMSFAFIELEGG